MHPWLRGDGSAADRSADRLEEAAGLARAIGLDIRGAIPAPCRRIVPATWIGKGTVEAIGDEVGAAGAGLVVMDCTLSPGQQRNLERRWHCKVIDRTALILEIFGARARTREGRLQVELAHLTWQRSRLVRSWTHLERQRGGFGFVGGPGESQIELDRRLIDDRIARLKRELETVRKRRALQRKARARVPYPVAALVGYTNAGKSTLFNRLTAAGVAAEDALFATLDPTMRRIALPRGRQIVLSDTVGFISDLPTELVAAFRATLEEVAQADVILHVRDIARPDTAAQAESVRRILCGLVAEERLASGTIEVWNKIDRLDGPGLERLRNRADRANDLIRLVSALTGAGVDGLCAEVEALLGAARRRMTIRVPHEKGAALAWLYDRGAVVGRTDDEEGSLLTVEIEQSDCRTLDSRYGLRTAALSGDRIGDGTGDGAARP